MPVVLIWIIIVCFIIFGQINKAKNFSQKSNRKSTVYQKRPPQSQKSFADIKGQKSVGPNVERNCAAEDNHRSENNIHQHKTGTSGAVPNVSRSYTETEARMRTEKKGKRTVAMRLYEGDSIPRGYRMVRCNYCAAENLIPYASKGEYMCYFCHEDL